jgi:hypothetical protein
MIQKTNNINATHFEAKQRNNGKPKEIEERATSYFRASKHRIATWKNFAVESTFGSVHATEVFSRENRTSSSLEQRAFFRYES